MKSLVEAIKELRQQQAVSEKITHQKMAWDIPEYFVGECINAETVKNLSSYVDTRLCEYASIYGVRPAINGPNNSRFIDEHVCSSEFGSKIPHLSEVVRASPPPRPPQFVELYNENIFSNAHPPLSRPKKGLDGFQRIRQRLTPESTRVVEECIAEESKSVRLQARLIRQGDDLTLTGVKFKGNSDRDIAYVTSFNVDYTAMKIEANVLIAPNTIDITDGDWFEMMTEGNPEETVRDQIQKAIKANLCIIKKTRQSRFPASPVLKKSLWKLLGR